MDGEAEARPPPPVVPGAHLECVTRVERTARNAGTPGSSHRDRFARHGRFVDRRALRVDDSVNGNDLASVYQNLVTDDDVADRHILDGTARFAVRYAGRPIDQRAQASFGAPDCDVLKQIAARIHQRDDSTCQGLAKRQRADHREERDCIHAQPLRQ
jgi:hypothetical protein